MFSFSMNCTFLKSLFLLTFLASSLFPSWALGAFRPPKTLSGWNVFLEGKEGGWELHDSQIPYELNTPLFSDYANKYRTMFIPKGTKITLKNGQLTYPEGSIFTKTFFYNPESIDKKEGLDGPWGENKHLIETRVLFKTKRGWRGYPYRWDIKKNVARLSLLGEQISLTYNEKESFTYTIPNKNQCISCHANYVDFGREIRPIGARRADNLLRRHPFLDGEGAKDQLSFLKEKGFLDESEELSTLKPLPVWNSSQSGDLKSRAKAYLEVNCAHCHGQKGIAQSTGLILEYENTKKTSSGICKAPVAAGRGSGGLKYAISPGHPHESIIVLRMDSVETDVMMPELGRSLVHKEGVELISNFIFAMTGRCE